MGYQPCVVFNPTEVLPISDEDELCAMATEELNGAASSGCAQVVAALLASKASPDGRFRSNERRATPLMAAASGGHVEVVATLLAASALPNLPSLAQTSALHMASAAGHRGALALLLRAHAAIHARDLNKWSALYHASWNGARLGSVHPLFKEVMGSGGVLVEAAWSTPQQLPALPQSPGFIAALPSFPASSLQEAQVVWTFFYAKALAPMLQTGGAARRSAGRVLARRCAAALQPTD